MFPRAVAGRLHDALADTPAVLVIGPRQAGKSTLVRELPGAARRYVTLDDAGPLDAALSDPVGFVAGLSGPVSIDEIQRAPQLLPAIKAEIDRRRTAGRFLLTGSANVLALPRVGESLAGRVEVIRLWPLAQHELGGGGQPAPFVRRLFDEKPLRAVARGAGWKVRAVAGGFPEAVGRSRAPRRRAWFESYLATVLSRDVRDVAEIAGLAALPRLVRLLATRSGATLNAADLARSLDLPQTTLKRYMAMLDAVFLTHALPAWHENLGKRLVKAPKLYLTDSGLLAHLVGIADAGEPSREDGPLLETLVVMDLVKQCDALLPRVVPHHFRLHDGGEVDVVLEDARRRVVGVEIKATRSPGHDDFRGLRQLEAALGERFLRGVVLYGGDEVVPFGTRLAAVPLACVWGV